MLWRKDKLFCEINPFCYAISIKKEVLKRHIKNLFAKVRFAKKKSNEKLTVLISEHHSNMIKRAPGVDLTGQFNKAVNIKLASEKMNGMLIRPGEVFSFWNVVGKTSKKKGYLEGRIIEHGKIITGIGGGLCNLANTLHLLVLHSPLDVVELHKHSDALAPDQGERKPFSAGASVCYNYVDYRFTNNTDQVFQLNVWCEGEMLHAELRSDKEIPYVYEICEEDHHFAKEKEKFYRISKIYRVTKEKNTNREIKKELIWDNHSEVMYDYALIPKELIR